MVVDVLAVVLVEVVEGRERKRERERETGQSEKQRVRIRREINFRVAQIRLIKLQHLSHFQAVAFKKPS